MRFRKREEKHLVAIRHLPKQARYFVGHVDVTGTCDEFRKYIGIGLNSHASHYSQNLFNFAKLLGAAVSSNDLINGDKNTMKINTN